MVQETENSNLYVVCDAGKLMKNWNYQGLTLGKETEACGRNCLSSCLKNWYQTYHQQVLVIKTLRCCKNYQAKR